MCRIWPLSIMSTATNLVSVAVVSHPSDWGSRLTGFSVSTLGPLQSVLTEQDQMLSLLCSKPCKDSHFTERKLLNPKRAKNKTKAKPKPKAEQNDKKTVFHNWAPDPCHSPHSNSALTILILPWCLTYWCVSSLMSFLTDCTRSLYNALPSDVRRADNLTSIKYLVKYHLPNSDCSETLFKIAASPCSPGSPTPPCPFLLLFFSFQIMYSF